jgi:pyridoxine 5'-phosphate synthase PdxJ
MARAMFDGLANAVKDMRSIMQEARTQALIELR